MEHKKLQKRDFYFGACLFSFLKNNTDTTPSIIEKLEQTTQIVKMTTNTSDDFYIFMKYTKDSKSTNIKAKSWTFHLSDKDKELIENYHNLQCPVYLFFICGYLNNNNTPTGEVAIYRYKDYSKIKEKTSITINLKNSKDRFFNLHISKSNNDTIGSKRTNIDKKITEIIIR